MAATILTVEDLQVFKVELLHEFEKLLNKSTSVQQKKWIKSNEVIDMLNISPGTLQNLRINGTLPYTKIGGIIFYDYQEILKIMNENRIHNKF